MPHPVDVYAWRHAIMSKVGPPDLSTRAILMAISLHMKADGSDGWPSQETIAERSAAGLRTVKRHLELAERAGWIERSRRQVPGQKWRLTVYGACVPDLVYDQIRERPWERDPAFRVRGATVAPRYSRRSATAAPRGNEVPTVHDEVPLATDQGAKSSANKVPSFGLLTLPGNSPENSPQEGALPRTVVPYRKTRRRGEDRSAEIERIYREIGGPL